MVSYLIYFLILSASVIVSLILLKLVVMKMTDFYDYINISVFMALIILTFILLLPKHISNYNQKLTPEISCNCIGLETFSSKDFEIENDCYGIKYSCETIEQFKERASKDNLVCSKKNDFYTTSDKCYYEIAKLVAGIAVNENGDYTNAFSICNNIEGDFLKENCNNYVITLKNGGVLFSKP